MCKIQHWLRLLSFTKCCRWIIDFSRMSFIHLVSHPNWRKVHFTFFNDIRTKWPNTQICNITFYQMHIHAFQRKYCMLLIWILVSLLSCEFIFLSNLQHFLYFHSVLTASLMYKLFLRPLLTNFSTKDSFYSFFKKIKIKEKNRFVNYMRNDLTFVILWS